MTPRREYTVADAIDALWQCDPGADRHQWVSTMAAFKAAGGTPEVALAWSASASNFVSERDVLTAWNSIKPGAVKAGTLFFLARQAGWKPRKDGEPPRAARPAPASAPRLVEPVRPVHEGLSDYGRRVWSDARPLAGTVGAAYLEARRCVVPPADGDLRFHPARKHPHGDYIGPALVALVTDIVTGSPISLHTTFICADGTKPANLPGPARLLLGGHRKAGGCVRLWPDEAITTGLGIGEGIETCLSLAHAYRPAWSVIDAGNLGAFPVLAGVEALTIARDNDPAGRAAAAECGARWVDAGRTVAIVYSSTEGADLNDAINGKAAA